MNPDHIRRVAVMTLEFLKRTNLTGAENPQMTECQAFCNAFVTGEIQVIEPTQRIIDPPPPGGEGGEPGEPGEEGHDVSH